MPPRRPITQRSVGEAPGVSEKLGDEDGEGLGDGVGSAPGVGEGLRFSGTRGLVTPPVRNVTRPTKATAERY